MKGEELTFHMMIGGVQKAGTTSLASYMGQHPEIHTHPQIECSFFSDDEQYQLGTEFLLDKYFSGIKDRGADEQKILAKHSILFRHPQALERLREHSPQVQLVLLLRDPVERAYSSYLHQKKMDQEPYSFREVLDHVLATAPESLSHQWKWRYNIYLGLGCYQHYLERIFRIFPEEQVHVHFTERLGTEPKKLCQELFGQLGVDQTFEADTGQRENQASVPRSKLLAGLIKKYVHRENRAKRILRKLFPAHILAKSARVVKDANQKEQEAPEMGDKERARLQEFYKPWNECLKKSIEKDLSVWPNEGNEKRRAT